MNDNRPLCAFPQCIRTRESNGRNRKTGKQIFKSHCSQHHRNKYMRIAKDKCNTCGFIPEHHSQMDFDHIDGNRHNNDASNIQVLCANCHRLKTAMEGIQNDKQ